MKRDHVQGLVGGSQKKQINVVRLKDIGVVEGKKMVTKGQGQSMRLRNTMEKVHIVTESNIFKKF